MTFHSEPKCVAATKRLRTHDLMGRADGAVGPRILLVTTAWPLGQQYGGQIRSLQIARALKHVGSVRVIVVDPGVESERGWRATETEFAVLPPVHCLQAPNETIVQKLRWAFDSHYMNVHGLIATESDRHRVAEHCAASDLVWVLNARVPNLLQRWAWPASHLDLDNLPSTYMRSVRSIAPSIRDRTKASIVETLFRRREQTFRRRFTTLSVCSEQDRDYLGGGDAVHVIPNGFSVPSGEPFRNRSPEPRIGFIGLGSYEPNIDGVDWFLRECWASVRRAIPTVRLRVAGRDTDPERFGRPENVDFIGEIADSAAEMSTWWAMVVPIRLGAGTRVKIAEAFSRKCPVVSTTFGAMGYNVQDGHHVRLADNATAFASGCIDLLRDPLAGTELAERAFDRYLRNWTWDAIAPKVWAAADACLRQRDAPVWP
jgi:glycosyltransferase involved in cell wall biosynthesis